MNIFKLLLDSGLDVNAVDNFGRSMLHHATSDNKPELVEFLLKNTKIDAKLKCSKKTSSLKVGETAFDYAVRNDYHKIVAMLKPSKEINQVIYLAICIEQI